MKQKRLLLLLALLMTAATGAWGKQIYISYPAWPSGTSVNGDGNLVLEIELWDSFEYLKSEIEGKTGFDPKYMHLFNNSIECEDNETLDQKDVSEGSVLTLVYDLKAVKLADGTKDAGNWTATVGQGDAQGLPADVCKGDAVTLNYTGRLKVKSVTATTDAWMGDLSSIPASALDGNRLIVPDGTTLKGTLSEKYKIVIPDGATVTLAGVTINGVNDADYSWAGITCLGDANIILADGSDNKVKGFYNTYPGIQAGPANTTLTIQGGTAGSGKLTASSNDNSAGIGAGWYPLSCGDIDILGGDITATGGKFSAGIGGGPSSVCGTITISGGTVTATGGEGGAGIGSGLNGTSGNITITDGVTLVTATKGSDAPYSIGEGAYTDGRQSTCGTVTIGGTVYWQNDAAVDDGATYLAQTTFELVNLAKLSGDYEATNGTTLYGRLAGNYKISIAADATVTLNNATINGEQQYNKYKWAGINCLGDATIVLKDGSTNKVRGFNSDYPGIHVPSGKKLTIKGGMARNGKLTASSNGFGAGIGAGYQIPCGDIEIQGGDITATGGIFAAGIGGGGYGAATCGAITISGGTVEATGGAKAAGIGSGNQSSCGDITIASTVKEVTATKGEDATYSIGAGFDGSCGTVTIGDTKYWENNDAVSTDTDNYLKQATITYVP